MAHRFIYQGVGEIGHVGQNGGPLLRTRRKCDAHRARVKWQGKKQDYRTIRLILKQTAGQKSIFLRLEASFKYVQPLPCGRSINV